MHLPQRLTRGKPVADAHNAVGVQVEHAQAGQLAEALNGRQLVEGEVQVVQAAGEHARRNLGCMSGNVGDFAS